MLFAHESGIPQGQTTRGHEMTMMIDAVTIKHLSYGQAHAEVRDWTCPE